MAAAVDAVTAELLRIVGELVALQGRPSGELAIMAGSPAPGSIGA